MSQPIKSFPLISGRPSLDIVNTEVVRRGVRYDLLTDVRDVDAWIETMTQGGFLQAEQTDCITTEEKAEALQAVRETRRFLRGGFERKADGAELSEGWIQQLEQWVADAPFSFRMMGGRLVPIPLGKAADKLVSLLAYDALRLQAEGELDALKRCANEDCVLLFADKSGRRKWCSMQICGNRKKVARFQQKRER